MFAYAAGSKAILARRRIDALSVDVYLRMLRCVYCCHDDACIKLLARIKRSLFRNDESIELVDTNVFHVNVCHERMQHFAFGIANITLKL